MKKSTNFWSAFGKICVIIVATIFVGGMIATMISADSLEVIYPEYVAPTCVTNSFGTDF